MKSFVTRMQTAFVAIASAVAITGSLSADDTKSSSQFLPITKVVLYKHGLGYIEREGNIKNNALISFNFQEKQMNDVLASFYAIDLNGGKIASVQYDTQEPISERLKKILISIPDSSTLSGMISQLKGAEISVKTADENLEGRILGLEPVEQIADGLLVKKDYRLVIMTSSGAVKTINLSSLMELNLKNEALRKDINDMLNISLDSKYANLKKMTLSTHGEGERTLRVGYFIEMPVWKCSYRLIFDGKNADKALLQGWALAENNSEDDWNAIGISFVAGNPLSFIMNLYSSLYVTRQNLPVPGLQNLDIAWGNEDKNLTKNKVLPVAFARYKAESVPQEAEYAVGAAAPASKSMDSDMGELLQNSVVQNVSSKAIDTLFSYNIEEKVSISRGKAAMIPILTASVSCRKLLYFREAFSKHVMNAAVINNTTSLTLDAGPVAFYQSNTSLGEGVINNILTPSEQAIIPYAVASYVSINENSRNERSNYFRGKLVNGTLTLTSTEVLFSEATIENKGKNEEILWIQRPINPYFSLFDTEKPINDSDGQYIFEVRLKAEEKKKLVIKEKRDIDETVLITSCDDKTIAFYASEPYLDEKTRSLLEEVSKLMASKAELQRTIEEFQKQVSQLSEKQNRIRQNLAALKDNANSKEQNLRSKWIDALSSSESDIETLNGKVNLASAEIEKLTKEISEKIDNFEIDTRFNVCGLRNHKTV